MWQLTIVEKGGGGGGGGAGVGGGGGKGGKGHLTENRGKLTVSLKSKQMNHSKDVDN